MACCITQETKTMASGQFPMEILGLNLSSFHCPRGSSHQSSNPKKYEKLWPTTIPRCSIGLVYLPIYISPKFVVNIPYMWGCLTCLQTPLSPGFQRVCTTKNHLIKTVRQEKWMVVTFERLFFLKLLMFSSYLEWKIENCWDVHVGCP